MGSPQLKNVGWISGHSHSSVAHTFTPAVACLCSGTYTNGVFPATRYVSPPRASIRRGCSLLIVAMLASLFCRPVSAQPDSATLAGQVMEASGAGIRGAQVK